MKSKIIFLFAVVIIFSFLGPITNICEAATIFTDEFDSYNDGDLVGQGGWIHYPGYSQTVNFTVQSSVAHEGAKAIALTGRSLDTAPIYKTGQSVADGTMTFYFRASDSSNARGFIGLLQGTTTMVFLSLNQYMPGKVHYQAGINGWTELGDISANQWHSLQIQWRSSDHKIRYRLDGGAFTDYSYGHSDWTSGGLDGVLIGGNNFPGATFYFDTFQENPVLTKNPVLIVPGLTGTEIYKEKDKLWLNLSQNFTDIGDNFMDPLGFKADLTSDINLGIGKVISRESLDIGLGKILLFDYTDGLIEELKNQGYIENETLFTFPYDWRYGVTGKYADGKTNIDLMAQKIQDILTQTGTNKVDVIAHSMGGLIVKQYVAKHIADNHIGKTVFVGVPNTGAPKALKIILEGDNLGMFFVSQEEIKKITENMPATYDLLPSRQYYNKKGSYVKVVDRGFTGLYTTTKDLTYDETKSFIIDDHKLNSTGVANSESLHTQRFDDFDLRTSGIDLYAINGCKAGTLGKIVEVRSKNILGQPVVSYNKPKMIPGDGTVPLESATNLPVDSLKKYYALKGDHSQLLSRDGVRQQIVNIIAGSSLAVNGGVVTQNIDNCKLNGKAISVYSPVEVKVTDQNGNQLGLADDRSVMNNIPNADFEILGDHKFIYLPTDEGQNYQISLKGTGDGTYTIKDEEIRGNEVINAQVFSNLPVTPGLTGTMNLAAQDSLIIKQNATSQPQTIFPDAVISATQTEDLAPPISTAIISGAQGQPGFYRSDVTVAINATDQSADTTASGVLNISYQLDGGQYVKIGGNATNLQITSEGNHAVSFFATDNAGNNENIQIINLTIDKTAPEVMIAFNPREMNLKFTGKDATNVSVMDADNLINLSDQAGNTTQLQLKNKNHKKSMIAEIESLNYNDTLADISKNQMKYSWSPDKSKKLKELNQYIQSKKDYSLSARFNGKNTVIIGKDSSGKISKVLDGLVILSVTTNQGDIAWSY